MRSEEWDVHALSPVDEALGERQIAPRRDGMPGGCPIIDCARDGGEVHASGSRVVVEKGLGDGDGAAGGEEA